MTLPYGIRAVHPSAADNRPFIIAYTTARTSANDTLLEAWNAATNAGRRFAVDLDGKLYSAALTAGDMVYAVTGGITSVRRLDSLAIGAQHTVLRSTGTAPAWGALALAEAAAVTGRLPYANQPQIDQNQVLGRTGAGTGDISAIATSALTGLSAAGLTTGNLGYGRLPLGTGAWDIGVGEILTLTRDVAVGGDLAVTGDFDVGAGNVTVDAATGDTEISGDLEVTGTVTLLTALARDQIAGVVTTAQAGVAYTLAAADVHTLVQFSNANPVVVTVPANTTAPIAVGHAIMIQQSGAGGVTVQMEAGVTVNSTGDELREQWSGAVLLKTATNVWSMMGDLTGGAVVFPTTTTTTAAPTTTTTAAPTTTTTAAPTTTTTAAPTTTTTTGA